MRDRVDGPDRPDGVRAGAGQDETAPGVPDAAAIRREHARPASDDTAQPAHPGPSPRAAAVDNADTEPESEVAPRQAATDAHASTAEQRPASEPSDATPAAVDEGDRDGDGVTEVSDDIVSTEVVHSGFQLELGQHVLAYVHGAWQPAVVASRDRRTVVVDYQLDPGPLGARRQRVAIDRVRPTDPAA
jgi:hypothetical protein